jgi:hypothetical protein
MGRHDDVDQQPEPVWLPAVDLQMMHEVCLLPDKYLGQKGSP